MIVDQIAAGNAGRPVQFRFAVHVIWSRVPELTSEVIGQQIFNFSSPDF
jgi:hypothetical protein